MDLYDEDIDPLNDRPLSSSTVRDVLSNPRWAYLLFELSVIGNQEADQTVAELADRLQLPPETVSDDLDELASRDAVRVTSQSPPQYRSAGCWFHADSWVELPDKEQVEYVPKVMFGAVGYAHIDSAVQEFLDEYGYEPFHIATIAYQSAVLEDELDYTFEEMSPEIPDDDIISLRPALRYAYGRISEDPLRGETYDVEYSTEQ